MGLPAVQVLLILLSIVGSAFYSGIETGLISINRMRLRHFVRAGSRPAQILHDFLANPDRLLGTTLLGTNLSNVMASVVAASLAISISEKWGEIVSAVLVTLVLLVFGEYLPKGWFQALPFARCSRFAGALHVSWRIMRPVVSVLSLVTRFLTREDKDSFSHGQGWLTRDELKHLAHEVESGGMLSTEERVMIHRVFELSTKRADQVMVNADRIVSITDDATVADLCTAARANRLTRIPMRESSSGTYIGIVNIFDVLSAHDPDSNAPARSFMRAPLFIQDDMPIDDIFPRLRRSRQPMCLVRDSDSNVTGLLTSEDILSEVVGEF